MRHTHSLRSSSQREFRVRVEFANFTARSRVAHSFTSICRREQTVFGELITKRKNVEPRVLLISTSTIKSVRVDYEKFLLHAKSTSYSVKFSSFCHHESLLRYSRLLSAMDVPFALMLLIEIFFIEIEEINLVHPVFLILNDTVTSSLSTCTFMIVPYQILPKVSSCYVLEGSFLSHTCTSSDVEVT